MIPKRPKITFIIAITLCLCAGALYGLAAFMLQTLEVKLSLEKELAARAQSEVLARSNLARLISDTEAERTELQSYIIEQKDIIDFLTLVEALGRSEGATVSTASLNVTNKSDLFDELTVTIAASGSREAVLHVLGLLEILPYKSYVQSASVSQFRDGEFPVWNGSFTIVVTKHKER